jgi:monofunctional biosynthetic peptidoglycan transglycosylase
MAEKSVALSGGTTERKRTRRPKASRLRRALRRLALVLLLLVALPYAILPIYASANPPISAVMVWKLFGGVPMTRSWVDLDRISPNLVRAVLMSEDGRFCEHHGVDWTEVRNALEEDGGRLRGASTITMQTVKNLFLWTGRSWLRKGLEVSLALYGDLVLSKRRIMEIYLNIVQWDTGIYGAQAAAKHYFGVDASRLTAEQAARLAAVLPSPHARDAANPGSATLRVAQRIARRAASSGAYVGCVLR